MAADSAQTLNSMAEEQALVDSLVARARLAQQRFAEGADQARFDMAALAAAWALMEPGRNEALSRQAVEQTGLGNVADKMTKNHRKTLGLLRDIATVSTVGVIREIPEQGLTEIARPIGVVGAVVPSTNPAATPANNVINALKCGNAIILSPSPKGVDVCAVLLDHIHDQRFLRQTFVDRRQGACLDLFIQHGRLFVGECR